MASSNMSSTFAAFMILPEAEADGRFNPLSAPSPFKSCPTAKTCENCGRTMYKRIEDGMWECRSCWRTEPIVNHDHESHDEHEQHTESIEHEF